MKFDHLAQVIRGAGRRQTQPPETAIQKRLETYVRQPTLMEAHLNERKTELQNATTYDAGKPTEIVVSDDLMGKLLSDKSPLNQTNRYSMGWVDLFVNTLKEAETPNALSNGVSTDAISAYHDLQTTGIGIELWARMTTESKLTVRELHRMPEFARRYFIAMRLALFRDMIVNHMGGKSKTLGIEAREQVSSLIGTHLIEMRPEFDET